MIYNFQLQTHPVTQFSHEWETAEVETELTLHSAHHSDGSNHSIAKSTVKLHLGLRGINVSFTSKCLCPRYRASLIISFEKMLPKDSTLTKSSTGLGLKEEMVSVHWVRRNKSCCPIEIRYPILPYTAGSFQRQFRQGQRSGFPAPILWVADLFTHDGEGIRYGRMYRYAGWHIHSILWFDGLNKGLTHDTRNDTKGSTTGQPSSFGSWPSSAPSSPSFRQQTSWHCQELCSSWPTLSGPLFHRLSKPVRLLSYSDRRPSNFIWDRHSTSALSLDCWPSFWPASWSFSMAVSPFKRPNSSDSILAWSTKSVTAVRLVKCPSMTIQLKCLFKGAQEARDYFDQETKKRSSALAAGIRRSLNRISYKSNDQELTNLMQHSPIPAPRSQHNSSDKDQVDPIKRYPNPSNPNLISLSHQVLLLRRRDSGLMAIGHQMSHVRPLTSSRLEGIPE